ncbi:MAG: beta-galactosidase [Fimbriimonadaceae bacterium]|nr:beta-galactosidase [Fimbriimonadaceae bacterium]
MLHGGDYNPDQWLHDPAILAEDRRLLGEARCNSVSVGIFAWAALQPAEAVFCFDWLDRLLDELAADGRYAVLATPSAAMPAWLAHAYPEVRRVERDRRRRLHGARVTFCYTSPVYRAKVTELNSRLAERYATHPALVLWHISNEYGGECHCELCQHAFRQWLRQRYGDSLEALNRAWWTAFWSHTYTAWSQIESPSPLGETCTHGLQLDWQRFVTAQTIDFYRAEIAPLRAADPSVPITTNFMGLYPGLDYGKFAAEVDVVCWDSYPQWHPHEPAAPLYPFATPDWWQEAGPDALVAADTAFVHDLYRRLKGGRPWLLMESTPSVTNWQYAAKLKRPGLHLAASLQAVAHGADSVQYFQWRKSRGASEKLHGAVVDHVGHEHTRVFAEVRAVGEALARLDEVVGSTTRPAVALICDWENRWAIDHAAGPRHTHRDYLPVCHEHYRPFWRRGVAVDVLDCDGALDGYRLVLAPMLYLLRPGVAARLAAFVAGGGTLVTTYWSGLVNESDLCTLGGVPGELRPVLGIWAEETDSLYDADRVLINAVAGNPLGLQGSWQAALLCDLVHAETATVLATYGSEFYAGRPALTANRWGAGTAYHVAARCEPAFTDRLCAALLTQLGLAGVLPALPAGVSATVRSDGQRDYLFVLNFAGSERRVDLAGRTGQELTGGQAVAGELPLQPYDARVIRLD